MRWLWSFPLLGRAVFTVWRWDARRKLGWIRHWLSSEDRILEIGSGPGSVLYEFRAAGFVVSGIDIRDTSADDDLRPDLYDGVTLPFADGAFDTALLLTMLHHTRDPDAILREAARVAHRLIIIEDVYDTVLQRRLTKAADTLTNLEFIGHPHTNRDDQGWLAAIDSLGLTVRHHAVYRVARVFQQAVYIADRHHEPAQGHKPLKRSQQKCARFGGSQTR